MHTHYWKRVVVRAKVWNPTTSVQPCSHCQAFITKITPPLCLMPLLEHQPSLNGLTHSLLQSSPGPEVPICVQSSGPALFWAAQSETQSPNLASDFNRRHHPVCRSNVTIQKTRTQGCCPNSTHQMCGITLSAQIAMQQGEDLVEVGAPRAP